MHEAERTAWKRRLLANINLLGLATALGTTACSTNDGRRALEGLALLYAVNGTFIALFMGVAPGRRELAFRLATAFAIGLSVNITFAYITSALWASLIIVLSVMVPLTLLPSTQRGPM